MKVKGNGVAVRIRMQERWMVLVKYSVCGVMRGCVVDGFGLEAAREQLVIDVGL